MCHWNEDRPTKPAIHAEMVGGAWSLVNTLTDSLLVCLLVPGALGASCVVAWLTYGLLVTLVAAVTQ